tara:strand:+ start:164 stop:535 length:372 start_codon:yes stop_codon:yes gene_type:complete
MTENQYEDALLALGCKNVTTQIQEGNGTTAFKLPTGHVVSEHRTGYIRRNIYAESNEMSGKGRFSDSRCYQLNPTYNVPFKSIGWSGELLEANSKARMKIWSRKERLKKLLLYTIKKVNNGKS